METFIQMAVTKNEQIKTINTFTAKNDIQSF